LWHKQSQLVSKRSANKEESESLKFSAIPTPQVKSTPQVKYFRLLDSDSTAMLSTTFKQA